MNKKTIPLRSIEEELPRRFFLLNAVVAVILMAAIFISISQFGAEAWHGRQQIALIIPGGKTQAGWNKSHYLAMKTVCDELDFDLIVKENVLPGYEDCKKAVDEVAARGVSMVFLPNGCHLYDLEKLAKLYPKIDLCTIEAISALWTSGSYSILSYEGSYLAGILAGLHTQTDRIGYIAPFVDPEINQGINAFALGAQRVNPNAQVLVYWTGGWDKPSNEEQAVQTLKAERVDFLTYHQNGDTIPSVAERAGIDFISFNELYLNNVNCIAALVIDWKAMYRDMVTSYQSKNLGGVYGFGFSNQMVDLKVTKSLNKREEVLLDTAKWEIENGRIIFSGEIFDNRGNQRCGMNESISYQSLRSGMNWLIRGVQVIGS